MPGAGSGVRRGEKKKADLPAEAAGKRVPAAASPAAGAGVRCPPAARAPLAPGRAELSSFVPT